MSDSSDSESAANTDDQRDIMRDLFEIMVRISATDARVRAGLSSGEFQCNYYPVRGQEAIPAGVGLNLRPDDYMVTTYRCLHDIVGKGVALTEVLAEMLGKSTGTSKGKGGPMHISDPTSGLMATTGIVGAGLPIANGLALAAQLRGTDQVTVVNFGDGATSIGGSHEALNLAALWDLPVIFVCQNNQYGEHTAIAGYTKTEHFVDRAAGYGMRGVAVDGTDPCAVYDAVKSSVELARSGRGPTFLECRVHRLLGHSFGGDISYMDQDALQAAMERDPLPTFRKRLLSTEHFTEEELAEIERAVAAEVEDAAKFALSSPPPPSEELFIDVFESEESIPA